MGDVSMKSGAGIASALAGQLALAGVSRDGIITEATEGFCAALGLDRSPEGLDLEDVLASCAASSAELDGVRTIRVGAVAGQTRWLRLDWRDAGDAQVLQLIDVGHEWRTIQALGSEQKMRESLLRDAQVGMWSYDPDRDVYRFSSALSLGYPGVEKEIDTEGLAKIRHPHDHAVEAKATHRAVVEGVSGHNEQRYRRADGEWATLRVHYRPGRRRPSGKYEMHGVSLNMTEEARARDEAAVLSRRLDLAMRAVNEGSRAAVDLFPRLLEVLRTETTSREQQRLIRQALSEVKETWRLLPWKNQLVSPCN